MRFAMIVAAALAAAVPASAAEPTGDAKKLQGKWQAVGGEAAGMDIPAAAVKGVTLRFKGNTMQTTKEGKDEELLKFRLDEKADPKALEIVGEDGKGKVVVGATMLYAIDDDTHIRISFQEGDKKGQKPAGFKTAKGEVHITVKLERIKE